MPSKFKKKLIFFQFFSDLQFGKCLGTHTYPKSNSNSGFNLFECTVKKLHTQRLWGLKEVFLSADFSVSPGNSDCKCVVTTDTHTHRRALWHFQDAVTVKMEKEAGGGAWGDGRGVRGNK